jgi:hypothetical protein
MGSSFLGEQASVLWIGVARMLFHQGRILYGFSERGSVGWGATTRENLTRANFALEFLADLAKTSLWEHLSRRH